MSLDGAARAFPLSTLTISSPVLIDDVGDEPIMLVLGPDGKSIRTFSRKIGKDTLEFYGRGGGKSSEPWALLDSNSLSEWTFEGCAVSGAMKGQCLQRIDALKDFWFDWQHYHPDSSIYRH